MPGNYNQSDSNSPRPLISREDAGRASSGFIERRCEQGDTADPYGLYSYIEQVGQSSPWQASRIRRRELVSRPSGLSVLRRQFPPVPDGTIGYLCGGVGSLVIVPLLFRPWLVTAGWDGKAQANAFGEIHATTTYLNLWSRAGGPALAQLTGAWALLAVITIALTVFATLLILRGNNGSPARVAAASTVAVAVSVIGDVFYLQSKGPELKAMVGFGGDLGAQVGLLARTLTGRGHYPMPGTADSYATTRLTTWALLACVISILAAAASLAQWNHNRKTPISTSGQTSRR